MFGFGDIESVAWSLIVGGGGGARIKSSQYGTAQMGGTTSLTVTISPVDPSKSIVLITETIGSVPEAEATLDVVMVTGYVSGPTQLTLQRASSKSRSIYVRWNVIEFEGAKVQRISGTMPSSSNQVDLTISSVDPSSSFAFVVGMGATNATQYVVGSLLARRLYAVLTNNTTVSVYRHLPIGNVGNFHVYVVEMR